MQSKSAETGHRPRRPRAAKASAVAQALAKAGQDPISDLYLRNKKEGAIFTKWFCAIIGEMAKTEPKKEELAVNASTFVGSVYSQIVSVTVTDIDITLEFVYVNPREKTKGQVVTRVTLPRPSGEDLAKTILNTIRVHEAKKKGEKND